LHFELAAFLTAAIGLLGLVSICLLVFGRFGVGSIIAFLVAGIVIEQVRDPPASTVLALRGVAEIGVGVAMPMSLTILGVFGGFVAFGFLGLFIGPTLIAIAFTLLEAWRGASAATPVE